MWYSLVFAYMTFGLGRPLNSIDRNRLELSLKILLAMECRMH